MNSRLLSLGLAALTLPASQLVFPGCATMINGPTQQISVRTQPVGAQVFLNGKRVGNTPTTVFVSRWGGGRIQIEMAGYQPLEIPLERKFNPDAGGNIYLGGVWIVVDVATGAIFRLDIPAKVQAELPETTIKYYSGEVLSETLTISTTLKPDAAARRIGQLERR